MAKTSVLDLYPQFAVVGVAGTAATSNVVVTQLQTGLTNMQKIGWEVLAIEYMIPSVWVSHLTFTGSNSLAFGITQSSLTTQSVNFTNPALVDLWQIQDQNVVTSVGVNKYERYPVMHDFGQNPRLMLPQNIYGLLAWSTAANLTTAVAYARIWFKEKELGPEDWYDLLQLRLPLGAS